MKHGLFVAPVLGALWSVTIIVCLTILLAFSTGLPVRPIWLVALLQGLVIGGIALYVGSRLLGVGLSVIVILATSLMQPFAIPLDQSPVAQGFGLLVLAGGLYLPLRVMVGHLPAAALNRPPIRGCNRSLPHWLWLCLLYRDCDCPLLCDGDDVAQGPAGFAAQPARFFHRMGQGLGAVPLLFGIVHRL